MQEQAKGAAGCLARLLTLLIILVPLGCKPKAAAVLNPGESPPSIELPGLDGGVHSLSDLRGKVVLLNFWATWCEPCIIEMPSLQRLYSTFRERGLVVLAVGVDGTMEDFRKKRDLMSLAFPIWVDAPGAIKKRYGLTGVPESFVIGRDGKLVMVIDPDDGRPVVRVVGPRSWDSPQLVAQFEEILAVR